MELCEVDAVAWLRGEVVPDATVVAQLKRDQMAQIGGILPSRLEPDVVRFRDPVRTTTRGRPPQLFVYAGPVVEHYIGPAPMDGPPEYESVMSLSKMLALRWPGVTFLAPEYTPNGVEWEALVECREPAARTPALVPMPADPEWPPTPGPMPAADLADTAVPDDRRPPTVDPAVPPAGRDDWAVPVSATDDHSDPLDLDDLSPDDPALVSGL